MTADRTSTPTENGAQDDEPAPIRDAPPVPPSSRADLQRDSGHLDAPDVGPEAREAARLVRLSSTPPRFAAPADPGTGGRPYRRRPRRGDDYGRELEPHRF